MGRDRAGAPGSKFSSRRKLLRQLASVSVALPLSPPRALFGAGDLQAPQSGRNLTPAALPTPSSLTPQDEQFLNGLQQACFLFFWEQANPKTGLIRDRCNVHINDSNTVASIASSGFGLTALCIGLERGFISRSEARLRVIASLSFLWHKVPTHRGFFFHFANINTGERIWESEISSADTAILLCGVLTCRQYFQDKDIDELAHAIFDRVDWTWLAEDTSLLAHGWTPELGFIPSRWDYYSELMMLYLLGM